jgi:hypothetical protein
MNNEGNPYIHETADSAVYVFTRIRAVYFPIRSSMSSVDAPLAPGRSVSSPTLACSTPSVHGNNHADDIELSEANAQSAQLRSRGQKSISQVHVARPSNFRARIQFFALCWTLFLLGWSDSSTGPLLPRIQSVYHVRSLPQARYI